MLSKLSFVKSINDSRHISQSYCAVAYASLGSF